MAVIANTSAIVAAATRRMSVCILAPPYIIVVGIIVVGIGSSCG
jgi:hypothetical protein